MISAAAPHQEERLTPQVVNELISLPDLAPAGRPALAVINANPNKKKVLFVTSELADLVKTWPAKRAIGDEGLERVLGLGVRLQVARQGTTVSATAEIDLGDDGRFWPSDEALARCKALAQGGRAEIVYEA